MIFLGVFALALFLFRSYSLETRLITLFGFLAHFLPEFASTPMLSQDLLQFIFAGLTSGAIYALIALGFCVVHNTMGIVNFAQVDFVSLGGMLQIGRAHV